MARRAAEVALAALGAPRDGRHVHISLGDAGAGGLAALDSHTGELTAPFLDPHVINRFSTRLCPGEIYHLETSQTNFPLPSFISFNSGAGPASAKVQLQLDHYCEVRLQCGADISSTL